MSKSEQVLTFSRSDEAFGVAKKKAVFGRRIWIVWGGPSARRGVWNAAPLSAEALERALAEMGQATLYLVGRDGNWLNYGPDLARVLLANMKAGHVNASE